MVSKICSSIQSMGKEASKVGKRKIPRYLYHLTSMENFKNMQKDGFCHTKWYDFNTNSGDLYFESGGIYFFDLMNFLKDWKYEIVRCGRSMQELLLDKVSSSSDSTVVLKIPTSKLDPENLKIRDQRIVLDRIHYHTMDNNAIKEHLKHGESALNAGLYRQKKCPIEFIYQENIPIDSIELVGTINAKDTNNIKKAGANSRLNISDILMKLFKNTPEEKAVKAHFEKNI